MGLSVPLDAFTGQDHIEVLKQAEQLGYTDVWSYEVDGLDCFSPLAATALSTNMHVGTAIANVYTRGPATLAQSGAGIAELAPGRFSFGIGAGSAIIIERWNNGHFVKPATRVRETAQFLRQVFAGERVVFGGETFSVNGFRLSRRLEQPPEIHIAALRPGMLRIAGEYGDGAILNWLSAEDVKRSVAIVREAAEQAGKDPNSITFSARLFVQLDDTGPEADVFQRRQITAYLTVPTYWKFHEWLGRGESLAPMMEAWNAGDRKAATEVIPEQVLDELLIRGSAEERRAHVERYFDAGIDVVFMQLLSMESDPARRREKMLQAIRDHAPR
jgi:probable F420-dependent oxidoreductase